MRLSRISTRQIDHQRRATHAITRHRRPPPPDIHTRLNYVIICVKACCRDANKMCACVYCKRGNVCMYVCPLRHAPASKAKILPRRSARGHSPAIHIHSVIEGEVRQSGPPRIASSVLMGQPTSHLFEISFDPNYYFLKNSKLAFDRTTF